MTYTLLSAYNGKNDDIIMPFLHRIVTYTSLNNYKFKFCCSKDVTLQNKLKIISNELSNCDTDYLVWIDLDVFILDLHFKLESITTEHNFIFSKDDNVLCSGFIIIKNDYYARKVFDTLSFLNEIKPDVQIKESLQYGGFLTENGNKFDQNTYKTIFNYFSQFTNNIGFIDDTIIQNPGSVFNKNAFAFHFWNIWYHPEKVSLITKQLLRDGYFNLYLWYNNSYI